MGLFGKRADRVSEEPGPQADGAGTALIPTLSGDMPLDHWPAADTPAQGAPGGSFVAACAQLAAGHRHEAIRLWLDIAARTGIDARHVLQAWTLAAGTYNYATPIIEVA